jgi:hypothetical protein
VSFLLLIIITHDREARILLIFIECTEQYVNIRADTITRDLIREQSRKIRSK